MMKWRAQKYIQAGLPFDLGLCNFDLNFLLSTHRYVYMWHLSKFQVIVWFVKSTAYLKMRKLKSTVPGLSNHSALKKRHSETQCLQNTQNVGKNNVSTCIFNIYKIQEPFIEKKYWTKHVIGTTDYKLHTTPRISCTFFFVECCCVFAQHAMRILKTLIVCYTCTN